MANAATELDPVAVTGSRLVPTDRADVDRLAVLTVADPQHNAAASWGELLRRLPQSAAGSLNAGRFGSLAPGTEAVALRGLGADATLVLLNGRRLAVYPFAESGSTNFVDLRSLPRVAVNSVEVLSANASAIYGSDAVAGVVNFQLNDHFVGTSLTATYSNTARADAGIARAEILWGYQTGPFGLVVGLERAQQRALMQRDRAFSTSDNKTALGGSDFRSSVANPGTVFNPANGQRLAVPANSTGQPTLADLRPGNARFDRGPFQTLQPESEQSGVTLLGHYDLGGRWEVFGEALFRRNETRLELSPPPIQGDDQGIRVPAQNPFNPFGAAAFFRYRVTAAGPRTQLVATDTTRLLAGVRGQLGARWELETAVVFHQHAATQTEFNNLDRQAVIAALAQTDPTRALNVFGAGNAVNPAAVIDGLKAAPVRHGYSRLRSVDFLARGPLAAWAAGEIQAAIGGELRWENLADQPDPRAERGDIIDFKSTSARGARETAAFFAETRLPLVAAAEPKRPTMLEARVAARVEHTDDFGGIFVPQVNLRWTPTPSLIVRSGFGHSFRAPGLAQLYSAQTRQARDLRDTTRFNVTGADADRLSALLVRSGGNPALTAESADSALLTLEWTPARDLVFSATAYRIEQRDAISVIDPQFILDNEARFPGLVQRQSPSAGDLAAGIPGPVIAVNSAFQNLARVRIDGMDFGLGQTWRGEWGDFSARADATWLARYLETSRPGQPTVDRAGGFERPHWRGRASLTWRQHGWTLGFEHEHIDRFTDASTAREVSRNVVEHAYVSWAMPARGLTIQLRVDNLWDTAPPFADNVQGYPVGLADPRGRMVAISARWDL